MNENHIPPSKPTVIAIAGYVGSGKSTIAADLSKALGNAPILMFDHYADDIEWPQDINRWVQEGADPNQIRIPKLKEDLLSLLRGRPVTDPFNGQMLEPSEYILLEEPSGGSREEIKAWIDRVVYIDTPRDVCVVRLIERLIDMSVWKTKGTFEGEEKDELDHQLDAVATWLSHYQKARPMYIAGSYRAQQSADIIVDGMKTSDEITADILRQLSG